MSAIEIMDPKMDSGFKSDEDMTLELAVKSGIIAKDLSLDEMIFVWEQLLMYYLIWLEGHTIAQTFFCCLYLHDLEAYVKPIPLLGAFVDAFLVSCRQARAGILRACIFDDEDFLPSRFNFDLDVAVFSADAGEVWKRVEQEIKKLSKEKKQPAAERAAWRLQFIGEYMRALMELDIGGGRPEKAAATKGKGSTEAAREAALVKAHSSLLVCLGLIEKLSDSVVALGPESLASRCFDPSVNRKLLVPGPPRTVEPPRDTKAGYRSWAMHLQELLLCIGVRQRALPQLLNGTAILAIQRPGFVNGAISDVKSDGAEGKEDAKKEVEEGLTAAAIKITEPNVLPRSVAQLQLLEDGQALVKRTVFDSLVHFLFPPEALQHCKKATTYFLEHGEQLFAHLLKLANANRARRFRRLAHIFGDFNALQHEAWQLDEDLKKTFGANLRQPRPCWVWTMEHCLQVMIQKLFLGFELELYDEAEFHMIYWYADYLFGLRVYNLNELYSTKEQTVSGADGKKGRRPGSAGCRAAQAANGPPKPRNPPPVLMYVEATQGVVRGLFRLLAYCHREKLLSAPPLVVQGMAQRFVLRFRPLEHFRLPHVPSFGDFQKSERSTMPPIEARSVLEAAQASFQEAAHLVDRLPGSGGSAKAVPSDGWGPDEMDDAKSLRKCIVSNQLAITQLFQGMKGGEKPPKVAIGLEHHRHLATVQVAKAAK
eukprot:gnl/TRDRNA2_/TRDRNA2_170005_c0_seq1.p1 gnl/TRDRNA2_/TRDRNA2_170005_c0~~gnl/TRDRNA2_/TRDRNA2_170005_c0_seq1.p1  ORF type:complete len:816 (+),score=223.31 gnl/TRDRNA2_/TRDRNA2_170005_c0_seq1:322-2448(+)